MSKKPFFTTWVQLGYDLLKISARIYGGRVNSKERSNLEFACAEPVEVYRGNRLPTTTPYLKYE